MTRYIDADKVLAEFPIRRDHYDTENGDIHFINGIETVMEYIDKFADEQPADVQEVKHGKWVGDRGWYSHHCSVCGRSTSDCVREDGDLYDKVFDFCPFCGARMDGDGNEM